MGYVLIIVSFVAMGGPKDTTPTIDHIAFSDQKSCETARSWLGGQLKQKKISSVCLPTSAPGSGP
jgi:hypothetical protein